MQLDLFKLHSNKDTPKGWIWVNLESNLLKRGYRNLLKQKSQHKISFEISKNLNAGFSTVEKHLIRLKKSKDKIELPLPLVIELTNLINKSNLKVKIINDMKYFICKSSTTKQEVKSVKNINKTFAKLIGAHIADGHSKPEGQSYRLRISDGRKDLVEICAGWIKEIFEINPIIRFNKEDNSYNCWFNNKIIARYLKNIFEIPSGKKAYIIKEPNLIKNSSLSIRKAFALGLISFDGGIKTTGVVSMSSMSKLLIKDLYEILKLDNVKVNKFYNPKKKSWLIESISGRDKIYLKKWLSYFERESWKYERLKFFINQNKNYSIGSLNYLFPNNHLSKINLNNVYNSIKIIKSGKIRDISNELNKKYKVANTTIYKYLYILEKASLIYKILEKNSDGKNYWNETIYNIKCQQ